MSQQFQDQTGTTVFDAQPPKDVNLQVYGKRAPDTDDPMAIDRPECGPEDRVDPNVPPVYQNTGIPNSDPDATPVPVTDANPALANSALADVPGSGVEPAAS